MTDRDVWKQMLVSLADYVRRLRVDGPAVHNPPRASPRVSCSLPLELTEPASVSGIAVDFSAAGLRARLDAPIDSRGTFHARIAGHPTAPDLRLKLRAIWARPGPNGVCEGGFEYVGFEEHRSAEDIATFFDTHPGLGRTPASIPLRREVEHSPPVMLAAEAGGVRKGHLLKLTRNGMSMACRAEVASGADVQMMMQVPGGHLRTPATVVTCLPMMQEGFYRIEVRFHERLAAEHLQSLLPVLLTPSP